MLKLTNLTKSFGGKSILRNLNLIVYDGHIHALAGANGSGKTTLFNVISGFIQPESGELLFRDINLRTISPYRRAEMGIYRTFQDLRLAEEQTVEQNIALNLANLPRSNWLTAILPARQKHQENISICTAEIAEKFNLREMLGYRASELSYGQQKLLTLACAEAAQADLYLFDEPVAGINPDLKLEIASHIRGLRDSGKTVLLIEHDREFLEIVSDRYFFLEGGKIHEFSSYGEMRANSTVQEAYV